MRLHTLLVALTCSIVVLAHPGAHSTSQDVAISAKMKNAHLKARNCISAIAKIEKMRRDLRAPLDKRQTPSSSAPIPHYTTIQNSTCIAANEILEGPYYIGDEYLRYDLRESQPGVTLILDIGVIDINTCEPFTDAYVELWNANATGNYGGYESPGGIHQDTWLRGGQFTNHQGMIELTTIYPGYYEGRAPHVHIMVHKSPTVNNNGTINSWSGTVVHDAQMFMDESWNDRVFLNDPYPLNTHNRTLNSEDWFVGPAGASAFMNTVGEVGSSLADGILGYITVAVDGNASYEIQNSNAL